MAEVFAFREGVAGPAPAARDGSGSGHQTAAFGPDPSLRALLDKWRNVGSDLIPRHRDEFDALVEPVERLTDGRRFAAAAAAAQIAANYAVFWHPGIFASRRLETALTRLAKAAIPHSGARPARVAKRRVLHVATQVGSIGGHVRMMWRWIGRDPDSRHSVALTRQTRPVPEPLASAVAATGGDVRFVNRRPGGLLEWARELQSLAATADLVILHVHGQDVVPFLALAGMERPPAVVLLNHADHVFWLGSTLCDLVVSSRFSGHRLTIERRGVDADRATILPICLELQMRGESRAEARRAIGLPEDAVVLLSIARALKYRTMGGVSYADAFVPLLRTARRLHLVVVGPGGTVDWSAAEAAAPGQIHLFPERSDTRRFLDAADIYVDSFPFGSITSLFEAGLLGLPIVTRHGFGPGCEVLSSDSIGLDDGIIKTHSLDEFRRTLAELAEDEAMRERIGAETHTAIAYVNSGAAWDRSLAAVYEKTDRLRPRAFPVTFDDQPRTDDIDVALPFACGPHFARGTRKIRLALAREAGLKTLGPAARLSAWAGMSARDEFSFRSRSEAWRYLVPEWLSARVLA